MVRWVSYKSISTAVIVLLSVSCFADDWWIGDNINIPAGRVYKINRTPIPGNYTQVPTNTPTITPTLTPTPTVTPTPTNTPTPTQTPTTVPTATTIAHPDLTDMPDVGGTNSGHDVRYVEIAGDTMTGTLDMGDNPIIDLGYIDFNLVNGIASAEGRMVWNANEGSINIGMPGGIVMLQVGFEQFLHGKNVTGTGITDGRPARISGASGSKPEFNFSEADVLASAGSIGLFTEDINNNANGYVTTYGLVRDLDTTGNDEGESWSAADRLYVSNTSGRLTNVSPTSTERIVFIGIILRAHATEGVIWVNSVNVSYLSELSGVTITSVADNELLAYDSGSSLWINQTPSEAGLDGIYLKLDTSNDPLTGNLTLDDGVEDTPLVFFKDGSDDLVYLIKVNSGPFVIANVDVADGSIIFATSGHEEFEQFIIDNDGTNVVLSTMSESGTCNLHFRPDGGNTVFGLISGDTYNGNIVLNTPDEYPQIIFKSGTTSKAKIIASANTGTVWIDAPGNFYVRDALDGGNVRLRVEASTGNVGIGTEGALDSLLEVDGPEGLAIETVTGNTALDNTHSTLLVNASGNVTITLPTVASAYNNTDGIGRIYEIKKIDADADTVTIDGNGAELVEFVTSIVLTVQGESVTIQTNGTAWYII